jgi:hypothetical protein
MEIRTIAVAVLLAFSPAYAQDNVSQDTTVGLVTFLAEPASDGAVRIDRTSGRAQRIGADGSEIGVPLPPPLSLQEVEEPSGAPQHFAAGVICDSPRGIHQIGAGIASASRHDGFSLEENRNAAIEHQIEAHACRRFTNADYRIVRRGSFRSGGLITRYLVVEPPRLTVTAVSHVPGATAAQPDLLYLLD